MRYVQTWLLGVGAKQRENIKKGFTVFAVVAVMVQLLAPQAFVFAVPTAKADTEVKTPRVAAPCTSGAETVVTPSNPQGWSTSDTRPGGATTFVVDATSPAGPNGALSLVTDSTTAAKAQYMHTTNTPLSQVTNLCYYANQKSGVAISDPSYQLVVCLGGTETPSQSDPSGCIGFATMVFEPYQNNGSNPPSPAIVPNTWQAWDVSTSGMFWSTGAYSVDNCVISKGFGGPPFYSLSQLQSNCPSAVAVGFGVNIGSNNPSYNDEVDNVMFNNDRYNFEPAKPPVPSTVEIKKVWEDALGNPINAPDNKTDINVHVSYGDESSADCNYRNNDNEFKCDETINSHTGDTISVTETGVPSGWEVDPSTVGEVTPVCDQSSDDSHDDSHDDSKDNKSVQTDNNQNQNFNNNNNNNNDNKDDHKDHEKKFVHCTQTVINKLVTPPPCGNELVANGGFENPHVTNNQQWDIFPSGTPNLDWSAKWVRTSGGQPAIANVELHRGVNSWGSHTGAQHTELDSDWGGPSSSQSGEDASATIFQDLPTVVGGTYTVSLWTSPRPGTGTADNKTEVKMGSTVLDTIIEDGSANSNTVWKQHTYSFVATSSLTRLAISDQGTGNSLGAFVDDVSVKQDCLSNVTICKTDNHQTPLAGWTVYLKGGSVDTVTVQPNGTDYSSDTLPAGNYILKATGTYTYRPGDPDVSISDAAYSKRLPTDAVYGGPFAPWVRENDFPNPVTGWLGIQVDDNNIDWGSTFSATHTYESNYTLAADGTIKFRILDDNYSDNSGSLKVDIYPVYSGVTTAETGCATLNNVPYGQDYNLGEMMQDGWTNESGNNTSVEVNEPTEHYTLINKCNSEACSTPVPKIHFIKVVCSTFGEINGNQNANSYDATGGNFTHFKNYHNLDGVFFDPLDPKPINPSEIPNSEGSSCVRANGWTFKLSTDINQQNDVMNTPATANGEYVTTISGAGSDLSPALQTGIRNGNFWVSENQQEGYNFAAIRCYNDALNGDNLEFINLGDSNPTDIYCIAYNVRQTPPPLPCKGLYENSVVSGDKTEFKGMTGAITAGHQADPAYYTVGPVGAAVNAGPDGFPGAWDIPLNDPNLNAITNHAKWVSNSAVSPSTPAGSNGDGSVDSWRLFSHKLVIPTGAINITAGKLYYSGDNAVTVFLVDETASTTTQIGTTGDGLVNPGSNPAHFQHVYSADIPTLVAGHTYDLEFSVFNWGIEGYATNPTGLIYSTSLGYDCDNGGDGGNRATLKTTILHEPDVDGTGYITSNDGNINCHIDSVTDCQITYTPAGNTVILTATPDAGSVFTGTWGGDCASFGDNPVCTLAMNTDKNVTAHFSIDTSSKGGSGGSSGGSRPTPLVPTVLGDSTNTPSGQVEGATTLPRTGLPTWALLMTALLAVPAFGIKFLVVKKASK